MGGSYGTPKPESTASMLNAYQQYMPGVMRATSGEAAGLAQNDLAATRATEPGYQQLNYDMTRQFAPGLAQVDSDIQRQQALSGAETYRQQLTGVGADSARAAAGLSRETNPNYWNVQDAAAKKSTELLGSVNLNGLSPGEAAAVERANNQTRTATGNLGLENATNVISNAINFGGAFNKKQELAGNAINTANNTATSSQNTGFNPVSIALGQPNVGTGAPSTYTPSSQNTGSQAGNSALQFGSGFLTNQFGQNSSKIGAAASRANANSIPAYMNATGSILGSFS